MLYQMLTEQDKENIGDYLNRFAPSEGPDWKYGADRYPASTEHLLRFWNANKVDLFHMFGDKFILERDIEYTRPIAQMRREIYTECLENNDRTNFANLFYDRLYQVMGDSWSNDYYEACRLLDGEWLANNRIQRDIHFTVGDKEYRFNEGTKTMKALFHLAKQLEIEEEFEKFRLIHSQVLNQKKLTGTLCLSIHPLDYITMSDNDNNWHTCMEWMEAGDYRMGTVEMMNSAYVVMAYLRSPDHRLTWGSNGEWNSKMWRSLFIVHPDAIVSIKDYPFYHEEFLQMCVEWLRDLVPATYAMTAPITQVHQCGLTLRRDEQFRTTFCTDGLMYNDFGSTTHWGILSDGVTGELRINYCGETECMWCGKAEDETSFGEAHHVIGECCIWAGSDDGDYCSCSFCGGRHYSDDMYWIGDDCLCDRCYNHHGTICDVTGDYIYIDDSIEIHLARKDNEPTADDYYITASEWLREEDYWTRTSYSYYANWATCAPHKTEDGIYYWNIEDVTESGLRRLFHIYDDVESYRGNGN